MGPVPLRGSCEEGKVSIHWQGCGGGELWSLARTATPVADVQKAKLRGTCTEGWLPTSPLQPETVVHLPAGLGGGWLLWLRLWRSDLRERSGAGCVKTA